MKRLFFALWPDETTRQHCANIIANLQAPHSTSVIAANLHVTLVFLGNIAAAQESCLRQQAATLVIPEITLNFNRLSFWEKPKVLCLTTTEDSPALTGLVKQLATLAEQLDIALDNRPYQPHVTLLKKVLVPVTLEVEPILWHAKAFCLVESSGGEYRVIEQWSVE